jgi:hypothetical protein
MNGTRKWSIMILVILASVAFRVGGLIDGEQWVDLLKFIVPAFMAANLASKFSTSNKGESE